jgi:hypothetical protein
MAITDDQMAGLRAFLTDDDSEWGRLFEGPNAVDAEDGYALMFAAAFTTAVRGRWSVDTPKAEVIRFVATTRSRFRELADEIDPLAAEALIQAALGDVTAAQDLDPRAKGAQVPLLRQLVDEAEFDDADLDEFLAQARTLADQMSHAH